MMLILYCILFIVLLVAMIILIITKIREKGSGDTVSKVNAKSGKAEDDAFIKIAPYADYDMEHDCILMRDGTYIDFIQIKTQDLKNASEDEIMYTELKFSRFYRKYSDDIKIIATNFPADTQKQQQYLQHKIANMKNVIFKKELKRKLKELKWLEKNRTTREFYFMIFGKNVEEIMKNRNSVVEMLGTDKKGFAILMDYEKKKIILRKLNNKALNVLKKR